jgi:prevent-host-death family protein
MDVPVTELRKHLSAWLDRVGDGAEVVITDRGVPVARIVGLDTTTAIENLTTQGVIAAPSSRRARPTATGRARPRGRRPVAELVSEQRR